MESKGFYRVIVVGPTGAGKSQFCNFIQRDKSNSKNKMGDLFDSCTQEPQSNNFLRNETKYEFIDTPGNSDSSNNDDKNLEALVNYLKKKEKIDYILLLLKFNERITNDTRNYIETLGKIFTPIEFYTHLSIFFTKFPKNPSEKENKIKLESIEKINIILKKIFELKKNTLIPDINVYFVDTEYDEIKKTYKEVFQQTIDIMMEKMKLDVEINGSINTKNLDVFGNNVKIRNENYKKEMEKLKKLLKEEKLRKENEEKERIRLKKELENERRNKKKLEKEKRLKEIIEAEEEKRKKFEELIKRNNEIEERRKKIEEEAIKKGIKIEKLDRFIESFWNASKFTGLFSCSCYLLSLGGVFLSGACPIAGPLIASLLLDASISSLAGSLTFGTYAAGAKMAKEVIKYL